jgi:molybdate transport system substrate-binding protein
VRVAVPGVAGLALVVAAAGPASANDLVLFGAGSLREAMTQIAEDFRTKTGLAVRTEFGPSGVMRERIEKGERVDVFTSADMGHPQRLEREGRASSAVMFARNAVCAFSTARLRLTPASLLETMLDPAIRLGTAAPVSDPLGDYTVQMFKRADAVTPGSSTILASKAKVLIGGPSPPTPGRDQIAAALNERTVDIFFAYCSGRSRLEGQVRDLTITTLPDPLQVGPEYGVAVLVGARPQASELVLYILSPAGQATLARSGFTPVALPAP